MAAIRRSPSTVGPVVLLLMYPPARTWLRNPSRKALHVGLITASPAVGLFTASEARRRVGIARLDGQLAVSAGGTTCAVSKVSVGPITGPRARVTRIAVCWY